jgi:endonuclease YncB( thermonuclease family)
VSYEPHGHDRYGRTLADVFAGNTDVGDVLPAEGLALSYKAGPEAKVKRLAKWCPDQSEPNTQ